MAKAIIREGSVGYRKHIWDMRSMWHIQHIQVYTHTYTHFTHTSQLYTDHICRKTCLFLMCEDFHHTNGARDGLALPRTAIDSCQVQVHHQSHHQDLRLCPQVRRLSGLCTSPGASAGANCLFQTIYLISLSIYIYIYQFCMSRLSLLSYQRLDHTSSDVNANTVMSMRTGVWWPKLIV